MIKTAALLAMALGLAVSASPTVAQDGAMDEIVVTGSRAIEWDPDDVPVMQLALRADNLIVEIVAVNDTREGMQRRDELIESLRGMARAAEGLADIDLSIEDDGALVSLTPSMVSTLTLGVDPGRSDTSRATLIVKTPIRADDTLDAASKRIEDFVEGARMTGRTLVSVSGDWELSIINPAQYRMPILELIADDARTTAGRFGPEYAVQVEGMSNRVTWRQSGPLDLSLFIPYELTITPKP